MPIRDTLLSVGDESVAAASAKAAAAYLGRQGIDAAPLSLAEPDGIGATRLVRAEALGSDLMVMGAYGHSRLRGV